MKKMAAFLLTAALVLGSSMSVMAADFTPSVTQKAAPGVKTMKMADGTEVYGIFKDKDGKEIAGLKKEDIIITPVSKRDSAPEDIKKLLDDAYTDIQNAEKTTDLYAQMADVLKAAGSEATPDDLVVSDLFDVSFSDNYGGYMDTEGNTLTLTFDAKKTPGQTLVVLTRCDGKNWEPVDPKNVTINADGTVTITFEKFCPVAFLTDVASVSADPNGPASPQTNDISGMSFGCALAVICAAALVCTAAAKKRKAGF